MRHLLYLLVLLAVHVKAEEKIILYDVIVTVNTDRSLLVTEIISVNVEGNQIKRGIYRNIPTILRDENGKRFAVSLDVLQVLRNGEEEEYVVNGINGGKQIRIGQEDVQLFGGGHTFTIKYRISEQVRFFDDYDEVYWNAVGTQWAFPVDSARVTLILPEGISVQGNWGYSGPSGATTCSCTIEQLDQNTILYVLRGGLGVQEGFTISTSFDKGIVRPITEAELNDRAFRRKLTLLIWLSGLVIVFIYYMLTWNRVGRDPMKGRIMPNADPIDKLSPAATRYIHKMGFDNKVFATAIVSLAVKGFLIIDKTGKKYVLRKTGKEDVELSEGERKMVDRLFPSTREVIIDKKNQKSISSAIEKLKESLKEEHRQQNFDRNNRWLAIGILFSVAVLIAGFIYLRYDLEAVDAITPVILTSMGVVGYFVVANLFGLSRTKRLIYGILFFGAIGSLVISGIDDSTREMLMPGIPYFFALTGLVGTNVLFAYLLPAPTIEGRRRMDEIEGLKMFLKEAERERERMKNPPEMSTKLFEKLLPYAVALGVEKNWTKTFEDKIRVAMTKNPYHYPWYVYDPSLNFSDFSGAIGSGLSSSISSSTTSSGSGGSGSSGGGGGGGGGGGW